MDESEEEESKSDWELGRGTKGGLMTEEEMILFRQEMEEILLPTIRGCLLKELGNAKAGKLKANQRYILCVYVIPSIVGEIFVGDVDCLRYGLNVAKIMDNICHLIQCKHLIAACKVRENHTTCSIKSYQKYSKPSKELFILPNHHYALHVPKQMRQLGLLMGVTEFAGERLIGRLRQFKTNQRIGEFFLGEFRMD